MIQATKRRKSQLRRAQERRRAHTSNDNRKARVDYQLVLAVIGGVLAAPVVFTLIWFILAIGSV